ncbi:MAG: rod shape-determining protein RodA [Pseudomonadota bacterium]
MQISFKRLWGGLVDHIDGPLLTSILALTTAGLFVLFSASGGDGYDKVYSQLRNLGFALVALWVVSNIPPQHLMRLAFPMYIVGLILLIGVAVAGDVRLGARRWLNLGITSIQPSELMKIAVPLTLAWYFHRHEASLGLKDFAIASLLLVTPVGLIVTQPDLGTALLVVASGFFVIFLAGLSWRLIVPVVIIGLLAIASMVVFEDNICQQDVKWPGFKDYQKHRVCTLLDPTTDPLGKGFHTIQSTIAIGSGGVVGKGWMKGTQSHLDFLPEHTTDFIFAVLGEEFGLVGNIILLILYLIVIARGLVIAANAGSLFGRLLAGAVTLTFFTYAFVNMGMVSGILPVVGVPLPLVSYGGTALVTMMVGFGILMSVATHRKLVAT